MGFGELGHAEPQPTARLELLAGEVEQGAARHEPQPAQGFEEAPEEAKPDVEVVDEDDLLPEIGAEMDEDEVTQFLGIFRRSQNSSGRELGPTNLRVRVLIQSRMRKHLMSSLIQSDHVRVR